MHIRDSAEIAEFQSRFARSHAQLPFSTHRLPDIYRADARRAGAVSNDLRFENNFNVLPFPIARYLLQHFFHAILIHQKLTRSDRAAAADACAYDYQLLDIGIGEARDDRVVRVRSGLLLRTIHYPVVFSRIGTVLDPEFVHCGVVRKMVTQRRGQAQSPAVVECSDQDRRASP